ncbi:MAG TPA: GDP-mannose 4,6-dehydratase, partial [Thermodesulfobacteriota bacterium]|nr:GDP-mannose 4,6-dehydratase [Thermodesulfobacteriota bacterium]
TLEFNALSTANLLEAIRIVKPDTRFYQASSSEMYGNVKDDHLPITERTPIHPVSPYAVSKAASHWMTVNYREAYGLYAVCGILFNHESALRGKSFVTRKILDTAVKIRRGMAERLELGNLRVFRDWGYAPYYVRAMWLMLQQEVPDDFIICSGEAHSLEEFVREVFKRLDLDFERFVKIDKRLNRPVDLEVIYGDNSKAREILGWCYDMTFKELIDVLVKDEVEYLNWELSGQSASI